MYKVKMDGNDEEMERMSKQGMKRVRAKQRKTVSLELSKTMIGELKKYAGIRNEVSEKAIVLTALTKALGNL